MSRTRSLALVVIAVALCIVALILATRPTSPNTVVLNPSPTTFQDAVGTVVALTLTSAALNPLPTDLSIPLSTATDTPLPTNTPSPTATDLPLPSNTPLPTTNIPTQTPTNTFTSLPTHTPRPTATYTRLPTTTYTLTTIPTSSATPSFSSNLNSWTREGDGGTWRYTRNGLVGDVERRTDSFYVSDSNYADFTYETTFTITQAVDAIAGAGVIFRSHPDPLDGCYMVRVSISNGGEISLVRFFPPRSYEQLDLENLPINLNTQYTIEVIGTGSQFTVYLNGQHVLQASDSSYRRGAVGLNINSSTTIFSSANAQSN